VIAAKGCLGIDEAQAQTRMSTQKAPGSQAAGEPAADNQHVERHGRTDGFRASMTDVVVETV
jgi:hypothetical protein